MSRSSRGLAWFLRIVAAAAFVSVFFLAPVGGGAQQPDTASISRYTADMDLAADGSLRTTEQLSVELPPGKRGIFRIFDTADPRRADVDHPISDVEVTHDGAPDDTEITTGPRGTETVRIGNENVFLEPGTHEYTIRSVTSDVFEPGRSGETLWWWDVIGSGWQMRMDDVAVTVALPAEPVRAPECVVGERTECSATVEGDRMTIAIPEGLDAFTPVTVRVAFDSSVIRANDGPGRLVEVLVTIVLAIAAVVLCLVLYLRTRERPPGMPVLFEPPEGVGPALGVRVLREQRSPDDFQATLFDLGERGVITMSGSESEWMIDMARPVEGAGVSEAERFMLMHLGLAAVGDRFTVGRDADSGEAINKAQAALRSGVEGESARYLSGSGAGLVAMALGWLALVGLLVGTGLYHFGSFDPPLPLLVAAFVLAVGLIGMACDPGVRTKRTADGRELWTRAGGFARFLTTDSSESRFDAAAHLDWYPRYLAWALAFGVADRWAHRFESQGVAVPTVPWIYWYGFAPFHPASMATSFDSVISSATTAYASSRVSSGIGGSFGGGGFSGGSGGGGGGGGSW